MRIPLLLTSLDHRVVVTVSEVILLTCETPFLSFQRTPLARMHRHKRPDRGHVSTYAPGAGLSGPDMPLYQGKIITLLGMSLGGSGLVPRIRSNAPRSKRPFFPNTSCLNQPTVGHYQTKRFTRYNSLK